ncbi:hypothetical protein VE00_08671 [Pseudogymnoascus sp. WSF 3629]|nr:hypothetical protein VE00_08671 [Pseudogymnoascus sp. WSF 3629]
MASETSGQNRPGTLWRPGIPYEFWFPIGPPPSCPLPPIPVEVGQSKCKFDYCMRTVEMWVLCPHRRYDTTGATKATALGEDPSDAKDGTTTSKSEGGAERRMDEEPDSKRRC